MADRISAEARAAHWKKNAEDKLDEVVFLLNAALEDGVIINFTLDNNMGTSWEVKKLDLMVKM